MLNYTITITRIRSEAAIDDAYYRNSPFYSDHPTKRRDIIYQPLDYNWFLESRLHDLPEYNGPNARKVSPSAVKMVEIIVAIEPDDTGSYDYIDWFTLSERINAWATKKFGKNNLAEVSLHLDESTPHYHIVATPITPDGILSATDVLGDEMSLKKSLRAKLDEPDHDVLDIDDEDIPLSNPGESIEEYKERVRKIEERNIRYYYFQMGYMYHSIRKNNRTNYNLDIDIILNEGTAKK